MDTMQSIGVAGAILLDALCVLYVFYAIGCTLIKRS